MSKLKSKFNIILVFSLALVFLSCFNIVKAATQKESDDSVDAPTGEYTWIVNDENELLKSLKLAKNGDSIFFTNNIIINGDLEISKNVNFILNSNTIEIYGNIKTKNFDTTKINIVTDSNLSIIKN